ncbi:MAG: two-component regulator propeller domain-containing protein, partial [Bacteroidota bacterium]
MFKKPLIAVLLIFISGISALSQTGKFYLSQFYPESNEIDNQNFDLIQDRYGVVYIANRAGVVTFDGHQWNLIKTPYSIFSMAIDSTNNMLYVAGKEGVGRIALNEQQELKFDAFLGDDNEQLRDIFTLLLHDGELYFNNSESIFIYNFKSKTLDRLSAGYTGELLQLFLFKDEVYVNTSVSGVKLIAKDKLQNPSELILADQNVTLLVQNNSKEEYLVGFSDNQLSTYKNGVLKPIDLKRNQNYLDDAEVIEGLWVNDSLVAVSTLKGGVVFVNIKTAKIEEIVNYQSGLPDNEVYALSMDSNNGVWVAHSEGFTRISPTFPFRNFNRYPGLEGKILTVVRHEGKLYVGTTLGLYHLDEVRQYSEKVSYSKKRIKVSVQQDEIEQRPKRGVFNFLRRKKSIDKPTSEYKEKVIYESVIEKNLEGV